MLVLDAPNKQNYKGRLAILDYAEMPADVICRRLKQWHRTACWQFTTGKRAFTGAPSAPDVVIAAYGTEYGGVLTVVDKTVFARQGQPCGFRYIICSAHAVRHYGQSYPQGGKSLYVP